MMCFLLIGSIVAVFVGIVIHANHLAKKWEEERKLYEQQRRKKKGNYMNSREAFKAWWDVADSNYGQFFNEGVEECAQAIEEQK